MLEILTPRYAGNLARAARAGPAMLSAAAKDLLPGLVALLIVLLALAVPVLLILWRLHRAIPS
ncbi:MAG: hypothetical protein JO203_09525 [Gammaproteobacteria bacterium]|nr:hypothetical protein [Gammaproteobacteria bacterium]